MNQEEYRVAMLERFLPDLKEKLETRTFDERDVRKFLRLFPAVKGYEKLSALAVIVRRRRKDNSLRMMRVSRSIKEKGQFCCKERVPADPVYYSSFDPELERFGREYGIEMTPQVLKEINLCFYSLLQFTPVTRCRFCLFQGKDSMTLAGFTRDGIFDCSRITGIRYSEQYPDGLITDSVEFRRIDHTLVLMKADHEMIAEVPEESAPGI